MARKVAQHRIVDLTLLLIVVAIATTLRSALWPTDSEAVANVATPIGSVLQSWQGHIPVLSAILWAFTMCFVGLGVGRLGVRYSLYPAYTIMGIPVFAVVAACVVGSTEYMVLASAALVMYLATRSMTRFIMRTERFGDLSLAMFYLGMLPLMLAPTALLYVALPLLVLFVRASWRDLAVAVTSLLLPLFAICYWNWCAGGSFMAPADTIYSNLLTVSEYRFFESLNFVTIILIGVVIVMIACAVALTVSDRYSIKSKTRVVLRFNSLLMCVLMGLFALPSATSALFALIAFPVAVVVPLFFVRMGVGFTETLYRLMLLAAAVNMVLLAF